MTETDCCVSSLGAGLLIILVIGQGNLLKNIDNKTIRRLGNSRFTFKVASRSKRYYSGNNVFGGAKSRDMSLNETCLYF